MKKFVLIALITLSNLSQAYVKCDTGEANGLSLILADQYISVAEGDQLHSYHPYKEVKEFSGLTTRITYEFNEGTFKLVKTITPGPYCGRRWCDPSEHGSVSISGKLVIQGQDTIFDCQEF